MSNEVIIRRYVIGDEKSIKKIIYRNFDEINSRDYSSEKLEEMKLHFTEETIIRNSRQRIIFVALYDEKIAGTASLAQVGNEYFALTVFVNPDLHGAGIGSKLLERVEEEARSNNARYIKVPASITAELFYKKMGYDYISGKKELDEDSHILMIKYL